MVGRFCPHLSTLSSNPSDPEVPLVCSWVAGRPFVPSCFPGCSSCFSKHLVRWRGAGGVSLYGQPVRQRMTGTANKEDECPRRTTAFRDDAGSRRGARRNGMTAERNAFSRLPRPPVSAIVGSAVPLRGAIPGAAADNRFAPANPIVSRKSGQFSVPNVWCVAHVRTSLPILERARPEPSRKTRRGFSFWSGLPPRP